MRELENKKQNVDSYIAGASGGTLLVLLSSNLSDSSTIKSWLIIIAPSITVLISYLWRITRIRLNKRIIKKRIQEQKIYIKTVLSDEVSKYHEERLIRYSEDLDVKYLNILDDKSDLFNEVNGDNKK
ncbi:MAG: hypothetical protein GQ564_10260 [Bacteroidales bacterium]|nr:hypothetical protein [Bacteroidales bacterium]